MTQSLPAPVSKRIAALRRYEILDTFAEPSWGGRAVELFARVFRSFFTTKELGMGPGLGLSPVRGIAANHGGFLTGGSQVNQGVNETTIMENMFQSS